MQIRQREREMIGRLSMLLVYNRTTPGGSICVLRRSCWKDELIPQSNVQLIKNEVVKLQSSTK